MPSHSSIPDSVYFLRIPKPRKENCVQNSVETVLSRFMYCRIPGWRPTLEPPPPPPFCVQSPSSVFFILGVNTYHCKHSIALQVDGGNWLFALLPATTLRCCFNTGKPPSAFRHGFGWWTNCLASRSCELPVPMCVYRHTVHEVWSKCPPPFLRQSTARGGGGGGA